MHCGRPGRGVDPPTSGVRSRRGPGRRPVACGVQPRTRHETHCAPRRASNPENRRATAVEASCHQLEARRLRWRPGRADPLRPNRLLAVRDWQEEDRRPELLAGVPTDRLVHRRTSTYIDGQRRTATSCQDLDDIVASPWRVPLMRSHDDDDDGFEKGTESLRVFRVFEFSSSASLSAPV